MAEFDRLTRYSPWINLAFVERERTPKPAIERSIRLHLARLLLSTLSPPSFVEQVVIARSDVLIRFAYENRASTER